MIRLLASLFAYLVLLVLILVGMPLMALTRLVTFPFDPDRRVPGRLFRHLGSAVFRMNPLWWGKVEGRMPDLRRRACVVVANHESNVDVMLLSRLPYEMKWMAKMSLFKAPWFGQMMRLAGDIPVQREDKAGGQRAMELARGYLSRGTSVMIFPEGTRSRDGQLGAFKLGAFKLAIDLGCPIVPIALYGTKQGMPADSPWLNWARPRARILPEVAVEGLSDADAAALAERVRGLLEAARGELAAAAGGKGAEAVPVAQGQAAAPG